MKKFEQVILIGLLGLSAGFAVADNKPVDDTTLTQQVQNQISHEMSLVGQEINVSTDDGVVKLSGTLDTNLQAEKAIEIAEATPGVTNVDYSHLNVKGSQQPLTDTGITAQVKGSFLKDKLFGQAKVPVMSIHVETKNGIVYLTGTANSKNQKDRAVALAKAVKGVTKVDEKITIKAS